MSHFYFMEVHLSDNATRSASIFSLSDAKGILNQMPRQNPIAQYRDPDGAPIDEHSLAGILTGSADKIDAMGLTELREECWRQYKISPFVQTSVNDAVGALCGDGFHVGSKEPEVNHIVHSHTYDYRNELHKRMPQYVTHRKVGGELFLSLSCHDKGDEFVEIDYLDPARIKGIGEGGCGIIFHPRKTRMPLAYSFEQAGGEYTILPSIYLAYDPSLASDLSVAMRNESYDMRKMRGNKATKNSMGLFDSVGGFKRFVVEWEGPTLSRRSGSYLRSVLIWWNLYALMKFTEVDHKRAMASFCYAAIPADQEAWKLWTSLSQEDQDRTGLLQPKPPGSTILCLPGFELKAISPQLPTLSGNDYDLQELLVGGLNLPNDVVTGTTQGRTFGSVKESRGPWGDRIRQDQNNFRLWLIHDLWKPILFLHSAVYGAKKYHLSWECVRHEKQNPEFDYVKRRPWELLTASLPVFSAGNLDATVRAWLGAKSASLDDKLGISKETIARKIGISDYDAERRKAATEAEIYPDLKPPTDDEQTQEAWLEPPKQREENATPQEKP